jgi:shikimate kinase
MNRYHLPAPSLPPGRPSLVVTGFMGTGKTSSGRATAAVLGLPFVDLDDVIVRRAGRSIPEIFATDGEPAFRALERAAVDDAARLSGSVVATGGGAVLDAGSFGRLSRGATVAVLTCDVDELTRRVSGGAGRPLLEPADPGRTAALLEGRRDAYARAGDALDTTGRSPEDVAAELASRYARTSGDNSAVVRIAVSGPDGPYPVVVGGGLASAGTEVHEVLPSSTLAVIVADGSVDATLGSIMADALSSSGGRPRRHSTSSQACGGASSSWASTARRWWSAWGAARPWTPPGSPRRRSREACPW